MGSQIVEPSCFVLLLCNRYMDNHISNRYYIRRIEMKALVVEGAECFGYLEYICGRNNVKL